MFCSVAKDVSPPAAAEQVKVRAYLRERVARGINAVNPWDWVEYDLPPFRRSGACSSTRAVRVIVPKGISVRFAGEVLG
jgi:hypothetical protein